MGNLPSVRFYQFTSVQNENAGQLGISNPADRRLDRFVRNSLLHCYWGGGTGARSLILIGPSLSSTIL